MGVDGVHLLLFLMVVALAVVLMTILRDTSRGSKLDDKEAGGAEDNPTVKSKLDAQPTEPSKMLHAPAQKASFQTPPGPAQTPTSVGATSFEGARPHVTHDRSEPAQCPVSPQPPARAGRLQPRGSHSWVTSVAGVTFRNPDGSNRQAIVGSLREGEALTLRREPSNPHDRNAIAVLDQSGRQVGFIPRNEAVTLARSLDAGSHADAEVEKVVGGYGPGISLGLRVRITLREGQPSAGQARSSTPVRPDPPPGAAPTLRPQPPPQPSRGRTHQSTWAPTPAEDLDDDYRLYDIDFDEDDDHGFGEINDDGEWEDDCDEW